MHVVTFVATFVLDDNHLSVFCTDLLSLNTIAYSTLAFDMFNVYDCCTSTCWYFECEFYNKQEGQSNLSVDARHK